MNSFLSKRRFFSGRVVMFLSALAVVLAPLPMIGAPPPTPVFTTVVAFNGNNGSAPLAPLMLAKDGTLYGTTAAGGFFGKGTVFRLTTAGVFTTLVSFNGSNGDKPWATLLEGNDGNFYGTTIGEYPDTFGSIFRMTPSGAITNLHVFNPNSAVGPHDSGPQAPLIQSPDGTLYGTTSGGSSEADYGTIFSITTPGQYEVVCDFTNTAPIAGSSCDAPLILASDGNFYGTTWGGGSNDLGTIFRLTSTGGFSTLFNFAEEVTRGGHTFASLLEASDGNFYGTTLYGSFYRLTPSGTFTVLHDFATQVLTPVIQASDGFLYGTTASSVFRYDPVTGALDDFTNTCGYEPWGALVEAKDGILYGTLYAGNQVYKLTMPPFLPADPPIVIPVGSPLTHQIVANRLPTGYAAEGLPAGLSVDPATGLISGTPTALGTFTVTLTATNAAGAGSRTLKLTVAPVPPPIIESPAAAIGQATLFFTYQITASNAPTSYAASGLPAGLSVDASSGFISGTPTVAGTFSVILSAINPGGTGKLTLTLTLAPAPPTVTLTATSPLVIAGTGDRGIFTLNLSEAQDHDVIVHLLIKGSAQNGTDYVPLKTTKKIKAGKTSKSIKIIPVGNGAGPGVKRVVALLLVTGDGYTVGTTVKVKVKIIGQ